MTIEIPFNAEIAHDGSNDRISFQPLFPFEFQRQDAHDQIAVHQRSMFVDQQGAIGVTVMRNADMRLMCPDGFREGIEMHGSAVLIDIQAVRLVVDRNNLGAQLPEQLGGDFVAAPLAESITTFMPTRSMPRGMDDLIYSI